MKIDTIKKTMIKVNVEYQCDKCGKIEKPDTIIRVDGYEEVSAMMENEDAGYLPDGWVTDYDELWCSACSEDEIDPDKMAIA